MASGRLGKRPRRGHIRAGSGYQRFETSSLYKEVAKLIKKHDLKLN